LIEGLFVCLQDRSMRRVEMTTCPELNCPESEQITLTDRCCKVCRGATHSHTQNQHTPTLHWLESY